MWDELTRQQYVILTGNEINLLDTYLYQTIGKAYYAHRHGYIFAQKLSNQYVKYYGTKFMEVGLFCVVCACICLDYGMSLASYNMNLILIAIFVYRLLFCVGCAHRKIALWNARDGQGSSCLLAP
jgi:hypothetical protein